VYAIRPNSHECAKYIRIYLPLTDKVPRQHRPSDHQLRVPADHPVGVRLSAEPTESPWQNAHVPRGQPPPGLHLSGHHYLLHVRQAVRQRGEKGGHDNVQGARLVTHRYREIHASNVKKTKLFCFFSLHHAFLLPVVLLLAERHVLRHMVDLRVSRSRRYGRIKRPNRENESSGIARSFPIRTINNSLAFSTSVVIIIRTNGRKLFNGFMTTRHRIAETLVFASFARGPQLTFYKMRRHFSPLTSPFPFPTLLLLYGGVRGFSANTSYRRAMYAYVV